MVKQLRERYKVQKEEYQKSYEHQLALKYNEEYANMVENTFLQLVNIFNERYPGVHIEPPRGREKSDKSLKEKVEKLEIERLCKKYAIGRATVSELDLLKKLIKEKISTDSNDINQELSEGLNKIFTENITLDDIEYFMNNSNIDTNIKKAILRISKTGLLNNNSKESNDVIKVIEEKYGYKATEKGEKPQNDILAWESIEKMKKSKEELIKLYNPKEYLKIKDLRAFKIVISHVPTELKTKNDKIKKLTKLRDKTDGKDKTKYDDLACIEIEKDFAKFLTENTEVLDELGIEVIKGGYKQKTKKNGYIADHLKFSYKDNPEYIFELQLRSLYREEISRAKGPAAHDKRDGKTRVFPSTDSKDIFLKEAKYMVPKYKIIKMNDGKNKIHKCSMIENILEYYLGYVDLDSEEFKKALEYLKEEKTSQK